MKKILPVSCVYYCSSSPTRHVQFDDDDDESLCFTSFAFCLLFRSYLLCFLYTSAKCCKMLILQFYSTHELLSSPLINIILKVKPLLIISLQLLVLIHTFNAIYKCVKLLIMIDYFFLHNCIKLFFLLIYFY